MKPEPMGGSGESAEDFRGRLRGDPPRPSWRERMSERLADGVSALIDATAQTMAWLAAHGVLEEVLPDEPGGTCDWGDCDEIATEMRWDDEHGWLPVCAYHAEPEDGQCGNTPYEIRASDTEPPETQVMG